MSPPRSCVWTVDWFPFQEIHLIFIIHLFNILHDSNYFSDITSFLEYWNLKKKSTYFNHGFQHILRATDEKKGVFLGIILQGMLYLWAGKMRVGWFLTNTLSSGHWDVICMMWCRWRKEEERYCLLHSQGRQAKGLIWYFKSVSKVRGLQIKK